mgnify:CR=1 FL=1
MIDKIEYYHICEQCGTSTHEREVYEFTDKGCFCSESCKEEWMEEHGGENLS